MTRRQFPGVEAPAPEPCSIRIGKPVPPSQQWIVVPSNGRSDSWSAMFGFLFASGQAASGFQRASVPVPYGRNRAVRLR